MTINIMIIEVNKMYFKEAVKRINKIDWELFDKTVYDRKNSEILMLGAKYLKSIALFYHEQHIPPRNPLYTNVAELLGYKEKVDIKECCNPTIEVVLENCHVPKHMVECHLQIAKLVDMEPEYERYLNIYEPMICLMELGFHFGHREGGLMVYEVGFYPLNDWYNRFLKKCFEDV